MRPVQAVTWLTSKFSKKNGGFLGGLSPLESLLLLVIAIITFLPMLQIGFLTNDDAVAYIESLKGDLFNTAWIFSFQQGRHVMFFNYLLSSIYYLIDAFWYKKALLILSHAAVVLVMARVILEYIGSRTLSFLFCALWLAFLCNSWEHNLYGAYPFFFQVEILFMLMSGFYLTKYIKSENGVYIIGAGALFFVAINCYELFAAYAVFFVLYPFFCNGVIARWRKIVVDVLMAYALPSILFVLIYIAFKKWTGGSYSGAEVKAFSFEAFATAFTTFIKSAFPLYLPFNYVGKAEHGPTMYSFSIDGIWVNLEWLWIVKSLAVGSLVSWLLCHSDYKAGFGKFIKHLSAFFLLLMLSVFLISLTSKYQEWVRVGVLAYAVSSYCAQFFAAVIIALVILWCFRFTENAMGLRLTYLFAIVTAVTYTVCVTELHNRDVLAAQRNSAFKWDAVESLVKNGYFKQLPPGSIVWGPEFIQTGGIVSVNEGYWAIYLGRKYGISVDITGDKEKFCQPAYYKKRFFVDYSSLYPHEAYHLKKGEALDEKPYIYLKRYEQAGLYDIEKDASGGFYVWSKRVSSISICNPTDRPLPVTLKAEAYNSSAKTDSLKVCIKGKCTDYPLNGTSRTPISEQLVAEPGINIVDFQSMGPPAVAPGDPRSLYFVLTKWRLE